MVQPFLAPPPPAVESPDNQPNFLLGILGGGAAMLVGAAIWGLITYLTEYQVSYMAIGLGALVGIVMRVLSKRGSILLGILAGVLSLFGCLLGNFLFYCGAIAKEYGIAFLDVVTELIFHPSSIIELFSMTFNGMDLVFYAVAIFVGFATA